MLHYERSGGLGSRKLWWSVSWSSWRGARSLRQWEVGSRPIFTIQGGYQMLMSLLHKVPTLITLWMIHKAWCIAKGCYGQKTHGIGCNDTFVCVAMMIGPH